MLAFKKLKYFYIFAVLSLMGCNGPITDYVKTARPDNTIENPGSKIISNGPTAMKVSPGLMSATSANASLVGNVTPTNHLFTSTNVSARVGISRSRTSQ